MQAYNNDIEFKKSLVDMSEAHMAADEFIQGEYGQMNGSFSGCSLGCTIHDVNKIMGLKGDFNDHSFLSDSIGIPLFLTRLQDSVFEGLDIDAARKWTPRFLSSIVEGVDLNPVLPIFLLKLLNNLPEQEIEEVSAAINGSKKILAGWISTGKPDFAAASSAASSAASAAASAVPADDDYAAWASASACLAADAARDASYAAAAAHAAARAALGVQAAASDASIHSAAAASAASAAYWVKTSNILIESIEQVCRKS